MSCPSIRRSLSPRRGRVAKATLAAATMLVVLPAAAPALAGSSAVVFMYHRFGESAYPSTNSRVDQLEAHIKTLTSGKYNVMSLPEIVAAIREGRELPDRTVGISVDDAFKSLYRVAWQRFRAAKLPFTLFIATDPIDRKYGAYMNWDQVRELAADPLVTIGSQTASHPHMPMLTTAQNANELKKSNDRFLAELGERPKLIAYPYGEFSLDVRREAVNAGFVAAFGQHSGALHHGADYYFLPRFAMNEAYGNKNRFNLAANALPLEASDITPIDPLLTKANNPPTFGFTVRGDARKALRSIACYASGQGRADLQRLGEHRIEVTIADAFPVGRARINCTMPTREGRWRWFGMQFYVPKS